MTELHDRSRRAEDDYFRRKDAELIEKARAALRVESAGDDSPEHEARRLADAIGLDDDDVIGPLHAAGLRSDTAVLLEWLPAVEVAWIDAVEVREREVLRSRFAEVADERSTAMALLTEWLFVRPPHEAMIAARRALRQQLEALGDDARRDMLQRIVSRCRSVGRASGGLFGLGALSGDERARIDDIREDLGDTPATDPQVPLEIPH